MTCRAPFPAPGSGPAHDALVEAFIAYRLAQSASDLNWTSDEEARRAGAASDNLFVHAINCGFKPFVDASGNDLIRWSARRVRAYGRSIGISELEIGVVLGGEA